MSVIDATPESFYIENNCLEEKDIKTCKLDEKVNDLWLKIAALFSAVITTSLAFTVSPWFWIPAVPLILASGALIWYSPTPTTDSKSEAVKEVALPAKPTEEIVVKETVKEVAPPAKPTEEIVVKETVKEVAPPVKPTEEIVVKEAVKEETPPVQLTNESLSKDNVWNRLAASQNQKEFEKAFSAHVNGMSLNQLIDFYNEGLNKLKGSKWVLPEPKLWKEKLSAETNGLNYEILTKKFSLSRLVEYSLMSADQLKRSFAAFADSASLHKVINEYEKARAQLVKYPQYPIPEPSLWKTKLESDLKFEVLMNSYSLPVLIRYSLIDSKQLTKSFDDHVQSMSLFQLVAEYEKITAQLKLFPQFSFPFLQKWKDKFGEETRAMSASEISGNAKYPLYKLYQLKVITPEEYYSLQQIADLRAQFLQVASNCEKDTRARIEMARDQLKATANKSSDASSIQKNLFIQYLEKLKAAEISAQTQIEAARMVVSTYEKIHPKLTQKESLRFDVLKSEYEVTCSKIKMELNEKKAAHKEWYLREQEKADKAAKAAQQVQADSDTITDMEYNMAIMGLQKTVEHQLVAPRIDMEIRISQIDKDFDRMRSEKAKAK